MDSGLELTKECVKSLYCISVSLPICIQSTSCKMLGCMNQALIKIAKRNYLRYADNTTPMAGSGEELKCLDEGERRMKRLA